MLERVRTTWVLLVVSLPHAAFAVFACERDAGSLTVGSDGRTYNTHAAAIRSETPPNRDDDKRSSEVFERFPGSTFSVEQIVRVLGASTFTDLRPVGTTSVVLRANLEAPFRAALKLATHERPLAPATEAAAYRLSRCLGLTTVPPAVLRRLPYRSIDQALDPRHLARWAELVSRVAVDNVSQVEVAAIFWVEGLRDLPIAGREDRQPVFQVLLQGSAVSAEQQLMAAQLSDLSVFDLLLGNGDRWSGGNVQGDVSGQWLYIRDHDHAFATHLSSDVEARLLTQITQVQRFSRGLIARVRSLSAASFEREWTRDPLLAARSGWLRERVLPGVFARRAKLLDHVQGLVLRHGEEAVLAFP
jgi:hypothetical protein